MRNLLAALLLPLGLLPSQGLTAIYDQSHESQRLLGEISYRLDTGDARSSLERVMADREGWISNRTKPWTRTGDPVRLWARFEIPPVAAARRVFIVNGPWEREEYFFVRDGHLVDRQVAGSLVPASERTTHVLVNNFDVSGFVSVYVPPNAPTTVFVRVASDSRFTTMRGLRYSLWTEEQVRKDEALDREIQGMFLGIMLVLVIYNLAIYVIDSRDASYLYYVFVLVCAAMSWVIFSGLGFEILWPEQPQWDHYALWALTPLALFAFAQFTRTYLDTAKRAPAVDRQMRWVALLVAVSPPALLVIASVFPGFRGAATTLGFIGTPMLGAIAIVYACIAALKLRLPYSKLFAAAVGCAALGVFVSFFAAIGAAPALVQAHEAGLAAMGILLSIGMGFRMRDLRAELAARQIEEARIEVERRQHEIASKHKSEFLANMSHELRTPLNAIIGFSEVVTSGMAGPVSDKQKEFVTDIRDSGKHLLGLINDILDLSKIEAGKMELDVARFNVPAAMDNALTLVHGRADRHGIHLEQEIAPDVADYDGDERKFKQIMLNLLTNAVKFTPEGGIVTMAAQRIDGNYVFSVKDTGIGIAPEDQGKVFEEFKQVGTDSARKAEGTGLGLALTRKLVELHGGRIHFESEIGKGSTFSFNLPLSREAIS